MKRRALIIGSALSGQNHLVGVSEDVLNINRFFTSSIGGGYQPHEIINLDTPSYQEINHALHYIDESEISIVYFSGHGGRDKDEDYIFINEHRCIAVRELLQNTKRQLVFVDACRTPIDTRGYGDVISGLGYHFSEDYLSYARTLYWQYVHKSPFGNCILFSTSSNSPALDTENGGMYTISLMTALHGWSCTEREKAISVGEAFNRSCNITKRKQATQSPQLRYWPAKTAMNIPIGINPIMHL